MCGRMRGRFGLCLRSFCFRALVCWWVSVVLLAEVCLHLDDVIDHAFCGDACADLGAIKDMADLSALICVSSGLLLAQI